MGQTSIPFVPANNISALLDAVGGSVTTSGTQRCWKRKIVDFGGVRYYEMVIDGRDMVTAGGISVTFMETFATANVPRMALAGDSVYGYINAAAPTVSGFLLSASAAGYYVEWTARGLFTEAI